MLLRWDLEHPGQFQVMPTPLPGWDGVEYVASVGLPTFRTQGQNNDDDDPTNQPPVAADDSAATMAERLGADFRLLSETPERHVTPRGVAQSFIYAVFERR